MRIAHVTDVFLPRLGGIEMQVHDLAAEQQAAGHDVVVIAATPDRHNLAESRVRTIRVPVRAGWPTPAALRGVGPLLRTLSPDVVHAHTSLVSPLAWQAARAASILGLPTVMTMHSVCKVPTPILRLKAPIAGWTDLPVQWTAVSQVAARAVHRMLPGHDVMILPNGIDPEEWRVPARAVDPRRLQIVSVMRLAPRKRPMHLLRTLHDVRRRLPRAIELRAVIVGTGPEQPAMERYLDRHHMRDWVTLAGRCDRATIREIHAASDLYLAPARLESFGIAALEARCASLPVIAISPGVGEFVQHGREGLLVHTDAEMADAAVDLLTDPGRLARMREHNRTTEPATNWGRVLDATRAAYAQAGARTTIELRDLPGTPLRSVPVSLRAAQLAPPWR